MDMHNRLIKYEQDEHCPKLASVLNSSVVANYPCITGCVYIYINKIHMIQRIIRYISIEKGITTENGDNNR